jgi:hypothetical protein
VEATEWSPILLECSIESSHDPDSWVMIFQQTSPNYFELPRHRIAGTERLSQWNVNITETSHWRAGCYATEAGERSRTIWSEDLWVVIDD